LDPGRQLELFDEAVPPPERARGDPSVTIDGPHRSNGGRARLTLGEAARIIREGVKDKSYRKTPLGQLVGRYLRWFRNEYGATDSTIRDYEAVLARMSLLLADREPLEVSTEDLREVIDTWAMRHARTRAKVTSVIRAFWVWAERRVIDLALLTHPQSELDPGQLRADLVCKPTNAILEPWLVVAEVHDEPVAARIDVFAEALDHPVWRALDRMPSSLVASSRRVGGERDADAKDHPRICPALSQLGRHRAQCVRRERDRMPHACSRGPTERGPRYAGDPELGPAGANEPGRDPGVQREEVALVHDSPGHLFKRRLGQAEPLVKHPAAALERRAERRELALQPARGDGGHDPAAGEKIERRQLLEDDERVPLRNDERGDTELQPARPAGEEPERHERLGDQPVDGRLFGRHEQVVGHPAGVEPRLLGSHRRGGHAFGLERFAIVREDQTEVELRHEHDAIGCSPDYAVSA
jgi:integrase family protein with SAM-like domain